MAGDLVRDVIDLGAADRRPGRILVVDDDPDVRLLVERLLEPAGFAVCGADGALSAIHELGAEVPALVLLDIGLPGVDGMEVLARIRAESDVPVIMLTGRGDEEDRVAGLRNGADDYVVKPFFGDELVARIESVLRRTHHQRPVAAGPGPAAVLRFPDLSVDLGAREVAVSGTPVAMTAREFDLLAFLAASPRQVFSREQLLRNVWASSGEWQDDATVTEHVRRIRHKIEPDPDHPRWVRTVRGVGYRFEP
jgi:DNA-binding response OmpR family regulator